jgi:peroxiredoxin
MSRESYARLVRGLLLTAVVLALIYAFSPEAANRFGSLKEPADRKVMPEFALPAASGGSWKLSDHRGKVVLINFWATWCPPCREETPALVNLTNRYASQGFTTVGITMDEEPLSVVPAFVERYDVSYPILLPKPDTDIIGAIESLPTSILIDKQGRMARAYVGAVRESDIEEHIQTLLSEPIQ